MKIVAEIPARYGSKRVKQKNLRLIDGKPLITYAINAAKDAETVSEVYVNTESDIIGKIAADYGINYYQRDKKLAEDAVTSDEFNYDFMKHVDADIVVMVNPVAPLITGKDIDAMVGYYLKNNLDTLIPVKEERLHSFCESKAVNFDEDSAVQTFCESKPVNFDPAAPLPMTQNIRPVQICAWTVCIWKRDAFINNYEKNGYAVFGGKVGFYPQSHHKTIKISTEEDFIFAEVMLKNEFRWRITQVHYDSQDIDPSYPALWMSEISYMEKALMEQAAKKPSINILEWGSGNSTIYFSKYMKSNDVNFKWHAIENYIPWHQKVCTMIKDNQLDDVITLHLMNQTCEERKEVQEKLDLSEYVNYPASLGKKFDFIFVDARRRTECLALANKLLAPGGVVLLHDAEREDCIPLFKLFKDGGKYVCENKSPVPGGVQKLWAGSL